MYKYYVNWKYVRQLKSLIKDAIKYVEGDKMQVNLMNKLAGIPEEPKPVMPFYFKAVYDAVNEYNRNASRGYHYRPITIQQDYYEPPGGYRPVRVARVNVIHWNHSIAYVSFNFYEDAKISREEALERCFKSIFNTITSHGLDVLVQMYNYGISPHDDSASKRALIEHKANLLKGRNALAATNGWHDDRDDFKDFLNSPLIKRVPIPGRPLLTSLLNQFDAGDWDTKL